MYGKLEQDLTGASSPRQASPPTKPPQPNPKASIRLPFPVGGGRGTLKNTCSQPAAHAACGCARVYAGGWQLAVAACGDNDGVRMPPVVWARPRESSTLLAPLPAARML
eukprot:1661572-Pyramimonas_sp.AAC.1